MHRTLCTCTEVAVFFHSEEYIPPPKMVCGPNGTGFLSFGGLRSTRNGEKE